MKNILSLVGASIIGGCIAFLLFNSKISPNSKNENNFARKIANYRTNDSKQSFAASRDLSYAAAKSLPSVVHISTASDRNVSNTDSYSPFRFFYEDLRPRGGTGSGVIISEDGYIATNNHVVENGDEFTITLTNNSKYTAKLVGTYPEADLAVLKIDAKNLPVIEYANSNDIKLGEWALAVGNPLDLGATVTAGIISAKNRSIGIIKGQFAIESFIQTDAAVNPGNSGGALVNVMGELIGINTAIKTQTGSYSGYSFAIPSNLVKEIVEEIVKYGVYKRPYLGIEISELSEEINVNNTTIMQSVEVEAISEGGSASFSKLKVGDKIIGINNRKIKTIPEILEFIGSSKVGEIVVVQVVRNGETQDIKIKLQAKE